MLSLLPRKIKRVIFRLPLNQAPAGNAISTGARLFILNKYHLIYREKVLMKIAKNLRPYPHRLLRSDTVHLNYHLQNKIVILVSMVHPERVRLCLSHYTSLMYLRYYERSRHLICLYQTPLHKRNSNARIIIIIGIVFLFTRFV